MSHFVCIINSVLKGTLLIIPWRRCIDDLHRSNQSDQVTRCRVAQAVVRQSIAAAAIPPCTLKRSSFWWFDRLWSVGHFQPNTLPHPWVKTDSVDSRTMEMRLIQIPHLYSAVWIMVESFAEWISFYCILLGESYEPVKLLNCQWKRWGKKSRRSKGWKG